MATPFTFCWPLAQLVEHRVLIPAVVRSNRTGSAIFSLNRHFGSRAAWATAADCKSVLLRDTTWFEPRAIHQFFHGVAQLVAHLLWEHGVGSSSLSTVTTFFFCLCSSAGRALR